MRPLAVGEVLDGAMSLLRLYPGPTFGLAAVLMAIQMALTVPVQWLTQDMTFSLIAPVPASGSGRDPLLALLGVTISTVVVAVIAAACTGVVTGMTASVVGGAALGRPVTIRTVWTEVRSRLWALVGLSLLIGVCTGIGSLVLFVGQYFVGAILAAAVPAMVLERIGPFRALKRSWDLTLRGGSSYLRLVLIVGLAGLVGGVLQFLISGPFLIVGEVIVASSSPQAPSSGQILASVLLAGVGTMLGSTVAAPFLGCVSGLIYVDRRMRAEGLDIELGQQARRTIQNRGAA
jgi:hypothetical protein